jgi:hypothetical protein
MQKRFVVVSGLPGSGKTILARQLAPLLGLTLIDKDDVLEGLFESRGTGDHTWRLALSRESDRVLQSQATASAGAVLVSFWHQLGMAADSGTPTSWLAELSTLVVNVHCACSAEVAATRFLQRKRHAGHLDRQRTFAEVLTSLRTLEQCRPIEVGPQVAVDTQTEPNLAGLVVEIDLAFTRCQPSGCSPPMPRIISRDP